MNNPAPSGVGPFHNHDAPPLSSRPTFLHALSYLSPLTKC